MAIRKREEFGETGVSGDFWKMSGDFKLRPGVEPGTLIVECEYRFYVSQAAYESGKEPLRRIRRVRFTIDNTDPKPSEIEAVFDAWATKATVQHVRGVAAVEAVEAAPGRPAVAAVAAVEGVQGIEGGPLEGGEIL